MLGCNKESEILLPNFGDFFNRVSTISGLGTNTKHLVILRICFCKAFRAAIFNLWESEHLILILKNNLKIYPATVTLCVRATISSTALRMRNNNVGVV